MGDLPGETIDQSRKNERGGRSYGDQVRLDTNAASDCRDRAHPERPPSARTSLPPSDLPLLSGRSRGLRIRPCRPIAPVQIQSSSALPSVDRITIKVKAGFGFTASQNAFQRQNSGNVRFYVNLQRSPGVATTASRTEKQWGLAEMLVVGRLQLVFNDDAVGVLVLCEQVDAEVTSVVLALHVRQFNTEDVT